MAEKITFVPLSYTGWGSLSYLQQEVQRLKGQKVLLVTDPFLHELGLTQKIIALLEELNLTINIYTKVVPEPPVAVAEELVAYAREHQSDIVVGLGGGVRSI